jgi:CRISPR-associated endonuclease Csn1
VAHAAGQSSPDRIIADMPDPWTGFRDELRDRISRLVVSLKSDHSRQGRLHEDTAYGLIKHPEKWENRNVVYRRAFGVLTEKEIARIRDPDLRRQVVAHVSAVAGSSPTSSALLKAALRSFRPEKGSVPRRVRLTNSEEPLIRIRDRRNGTVYKALTPGENWCIDIFEQPDGTWRGAAIRIFDANQPTALDEKRKGHPAARRVMRLHKGDYLKLEDGGAERIFRVVRLRAKAGQLMLAEHNEAGMLQERHKDKGDPFEWLNASYNELKRRGARKIAVDFLGRVRDPGPPT